MYLLVGMFENIKPDNSELGGSAFSFTCTGTQWYEGGLGILSKVCICSDDLNQPPLPLAKVINCFHALFQKK